VRSCLELGHFVSYCARKDSCKRPSCKGCHTILLHPIELPTSSSTSSDVITSSADSCSSQQIAVNNGFIDVPIYNKSSLPIVPVKVRLKNVGHSVVTQAFLDTGSTSSFITCDLIDKFGIGKKPLQLRLLL